MVESFWSRGNICSDIFQFTSGIAYRLLCRKARSFSWLMKDIPPSKWPLGRISKLHPGKDGQVRVVTVRTQTSTLKRPIVKLCPLPNSD